MLKRERRLFDEASPVRNGGESISEAIRSKVALLRLQWLLSRTRPGSEKWHRIQHAMSLGAPVGVEMMLRSEFYVKSLRKCGEGLCVLPLVHVSYPMNLQLGNNVFLNRGVSITASADVTIGNDVLVGPYTVINSGNHGFADCDKPMAHQEHEVEPIVIEDDVWLGAHVVVLAGVRIGRGAVVGAGAVITKAVEPFSIVGGVPARELGRRGDPLP